VLVVVILFRVTWNCLDGFIVRVVYFCGYGLFIVVVVIVILLIVLFNEFSFLRIKVRKPRVSHRFILSALKLFRKEIALLLNIRFDGCFRLAMNRSVGVTIRSRTIFFVSSCDVCSFWHRNSVNILFSSFSIRTDSSRCLVKSFFLDLLFFACSRFFSLNP
jgi:hypothetical protein